MDASVRVTGIDELTASFDRIQAEIPKTLQGVVKKGAQNIKDDARKRAEGMRHAPAYPRSIGYDVITRANSVRAEIGPDKLKRQGALGNLIEYGSVNNAPRPHLQPALDAEAPRFERATADAVQELVDRV